MGTYIRPISSSQDFTTTPVQNAPGTDSILESQSSPAWVLTFVRWNIRDPLRTPSHNPNATRSTLIVVENDCLQVSVTSSKGSLTPSMSAVLVQTDINYETAIEPGDFVFVNMLNWPIDARRIVNQAAAAQPINNLGDGFKGFFKVQSVRKSLVVDPETGTKRVLFNIDAFAFTEFNNTIYFDPNLINVKDLSNTALFIGNIAKNWANYISKAGKPHLQEILAFLIQNLIGTGVNAQARTVQGMTISPNVHFLIPTVVGKLMGLPSATSAKDVYYYYFGIQQYASGSSTQVWDGFNPSNLQSTEAYPNFFYTDTYCQGNSLLKPDYWNQVKVWSIMNQYTNSPLNELYTCFKISQQNKLVMPTVVFRQIPFTSEDFATQKFGTQDSTASTITVTKFLSLPRWQIDTGLALSYNLGRDEAARINFVQYYAKSNLSDTGVDYSGEVARRNYVYDQSDITRNGLHPYVISNNFDDLPDTLIFAAPRWARILGDALIGGHLKMSGSIECVGIEDPIAPGDNAQFDGVVYHIEQVSHTCIQSPDGKKTFRTSLSLSHGVSINSTAAGTKYAEMTDTNAYTKRADDAQNSAILPGVTENQDTQNRVDKKTGILNLDLIPSLNRPFAQPSTNGKKQTGE